MASKNIFSEFGTAPDFMVAGISSGERIYRLCWAMNQNLTLDFSKSDDYEVILPKENEPAYFPLYMYDNPEQERTVYLLANKSGNKIILPEWNLADYLMVFQGGFEKKQITGILDDIKGLQWIQACFLIDRKKIKSIKNLVF